MKNKKTALVLAIIAGLLCISVFVYKYARSKKTDYTILVAGLFVVSFGVSTYYTKPKV